MAVLLTPPVLQFFDNDGDPLAGGKLYTYVAGTVDTPKATFTDSTGATPATNPITLDAAGRATVWINGAYKFVLKDALDNTIKTTDNVTSFTTVADAASSYFQSFSGNGSQTAFTLSTSLGTDENAIMVFVDAGGATSTVDTNTPYFESLTASGGQTAYTLARDLGTDENAILVFSNTTTKGYEPLKSSQFTVNGTSLTLTAAPSVTGADAVLVYKNPILTGATIGVGRQVLAPSQYTLSGTSLTFASAPASGTNNTLVFAPSTLVGAASASAAAADASANAANVSAVAAAASAAAALVSENNAAASYDSFDDRYLGAKASDPTLDNDGNALVVGAIYFNSVSSIMRVWSGTVWANVSQGNLADGDKGDITVSSSGTVWTVDNNTITNAKLAQVATTTIKGRITAGTGNVEDLTGTQATTLLDTFTTSLKGLAPASGGGTANFLRADGTWTSAGSRYVSFNATTSGSSIDITGIPASVVVIHLIFYLVSTNGTSGLVVQIGDSGGIETSGYNSCCETATYTSGFNVTPTVIAATNTREGRVTLSQVGGAFWACDSTLADSTNATTAKAAGSKGLSANLDRIRITTQGGANTFDGGSITVIYG